MSKTMLIDAAHAEETRVAIVDGRQVEEFDFESRAKRQLRGNIYLAKVTRVEPSLQAAFVEYGGNRHGFLAFNEIHPDYYQIPVADREAIMAEAASDDDDDDLARDSADDDSDPDAVLADEERLKRRLMRRYKIQDVIRRRQILLVQVVKDERGAKGAALTTWLSLAGRYCVLMPNTGKGGGISRKITNTSDRRRLKSATQSLNVPKGMGLIIRTAGAKRTKAEIRRDYEYLLRLWETIRETTLNSHAPSLIYEEENLVRRAVRDMFDKDFDGIQVEGVEGFKEARDFMRVLMPSQAKKVHLYQGARPLFASNGIEELLTQIHQPVVPLKSGGYLVINQTEALVAIDVNSGRATKERNIEATAFKTNMEAAAEAARQLRLRDLAGLIVIDFIDMDEGKNNRAVEKCLKDALARDRARIQMGKISGFGLMEISRQRRRLGVIEGATEACACCQGTGRVRSAESAALLTLRAVDIEVGRSGAGSINLRVPTPVALYILNHKRAHLQRLLDQRGLEVVVLIDDSLGRGEHAIERTSVDEDFTAPENTIDLSFLNDGFDDSLYADEDDADDEDDIIDLEREDSDDDEARERQEAHDGDSGNRRRRRRRRGGDRDDEVASDEDGASEAAVDGEDDDSDGGRRRRRGRRGGRRIREDGERDVYGWVRGRTPSLDDPYVWFDPLNPQGDAPVRASDSADASAGSDAPSADAESRQDERDEDRSGRRSRRRRGRGRNRGEAQGLPHDAKVEDRADNEGMPVEGDPSRPFATVASDADAEGQVAETNVAEAGGTPEIKPEPKRRRVRRKPARDAVEGAAENADEAPAPVEVTVEPVVEAEAISEPAQPEPAVLDVTPAEAAEQAAESDVENDTETSSEIVDSATEAPQADVVLSDYTAAPQPEVDLSSIIDNDPNQIVAPPAKPKRGWWRR